MKKFISAVFVILTSVSAWASRDVMREPEKGQPVRLYCETDSMNMYFTVESNRPYKGSMTDHFLTEDTITLSSVGGGSEDLKIHVVRSDSAQLSFAYDNMERGVAMVQVYFGSDIDWYDYDHAFAGTLQADDRITKLACQFLP